MVFAPTIFATVVLGIVRMENMKEVGRVRVRALIYFKVLSTLALALGMIVVDLVQPGAGMNVNPATLDVKSIASYIVTAAKLAGIVDFLINKAPASVVEAFAKNEIVVFSTLFGIALSRIGARAAPVIDVLDSFVHGVFSIVVMIIKLAPLAAFGAMAFTVGKCGLGSIA